MREIAACIFQEMVGQEGGHQLRYHCLPFLIKSIDEFFEGVLSIQIGDKLLYPTIHHLSLDLVRTLIVAKVDTVTCRNVKGIAFKFWLHCCHGYCLSTMSLKDFPLK